MRLSRIFARKYFGVNGGLGEFIETAIMLSMMYLMVALMYGGFFICFGRLGY